MHSVFAQQTFSIVPTSRHMNKHPDHPNVVARLTTNGRSIVLKLKYNNSDRTEPSSNKLMKCIVQFILVQQTLDHDINIQVHILYRSMRKISIELHVNSNRLRMILNRVQIVFVVA